MAFIFGRRQQPSPGLFVGSGKLDEISAAVNEHCAQLVIFNHALTPSQERNLEQAMQCRVLDRTGLILDIFAQRARSHAGKLQVELAQLRHLSTRLVRGWTHLERQKGGIGLRGPGETQLETDRRLVRERIRTIDKRLKKVHRQREQGRRARFRAEVAVVSLVGYTNAGKSTLFNALTESEVLTADQLFATLDPTMRRCQLDARQAVVLADTVGFIRHLPHQVVDAFRATLEEAKNAQLLVHVVDAQAEERQDNMEQVHRVLADIGAENLPRLEVFNKIDLLDNGSARLEWDGAGRPCRVWLSARSGEGLDLLRQAIGEFVAFDIVEQSVAIAPGQGRLRALLYASGDVFGEEVSDDGHSRLSVRLPRAQLERLLRAGQERQPESAQQTFACLMTVYSNP